MYTFSCSTAAAATTITTLRVYCFSIIFDRENLINHPAIPGYSANKLGERRPNQTNVKNNKTKEM